MGLLLGSFNGGQQAAQPGLNGIPQGTGVGTTKGGMKNQNASQSPNQQGAQGMSQGFNGMGQGFNGAMGQYAPNSILPRMSSPINQQHIGGLGGQTSNPLGSLQPPQAPAMNGTPITTQTGFHV